MKRKLTYLLSFILSTIGIAENQPVPIAKFSFNNKSAEDEISHRKPKLLNTTFAKDRFGNSNNAVFIFGNQDSYINLGNYPALKPKSGSISIWVKIENLIYSGQGIEVNPVITTRNCSCSDFNEAYTICFDLKEKGFTSVVSNDSLKQVHTQNIEPVNSFVWNHLVLTYDFNSVSLYLNGKLQSTAGKKLETYFEPTDSVMVGIVFNKKNKRVLRGVVDDIAFYDRVLSPQEVYTLYNAPNPNKNVVLFRRILWGLGILFILVCIYFLIRYRFNLKLKQERQRLELSNKQLENELRINRALMNPHFVFNAMNTLHNYILTNNTEKASDYLIKFSKLIRKILDSNMSDTISLEQELELIELYLEIESLRFKERFGHIILKDAGVVPSAIVIPIMMLQPFIENSVWHGLREKDGEKIITITFSMHETNYLKCVIEDNGIGRKTRPANPFEKKSLATNFVLQRLAMLNRIHNLNCSLKIIDKEQGQGTIVEIVLPLVNKLSRYALTLHTY